MKKGLSIILSIVCLTVSSVSFAENANNKDRRTDAKETGGQAMFGLVKNPAEPFLISRSIYEKIKAAEEVYWAGGRNVLLKNGTGYSLIDLQACEAIPMPVALPEDYGEFDPWMKQDGWVADSNEKYYCFFNLRSGCSLVKRQDPDKPHKEYNVWGTWTNPDTGASILLFLGDDFSEVYGESGELLNRLEWKAKNMDQTVEDNANYEPVTNGCLLGYRKQDGCAVIRDIFTGQDIRVFAPGFNWRTYDGECQIYEDGTALLTDWDQGENAIVGLDGLDLIRTSSYVYDRSAAGFYVFGEDYDSETKTSSYYTWDQNACEIYHVIETDVDEEQTTAKKRRVEPGEEIPETVYLPEIADGRAAGRYSVLIPDFVFEWQDSKIYIRKKNGELLGGQPWSDIWHLTTLDGVGYNHEQFFVRNGFLPVKSMEGKWGVLATDGHMILPAEYDKLLGSDTGSDSECCVGFAAWKDGEVRIFDLNGQPVFCVTDE